MKEHVSSQYFFSVKAFYSLLEYLFWIHFLYCCKTHEVMCLKPVFRDHSSLFF